MQLYHIAIDVYRHREHIHGDNFISPVDPIAERLL
jgi:hypothetical protein